MTRRAACATLVLASAALLQAQQQVFRAGRTTVAVPVSVFDAAGRMVTHLRTEHFRLFDEDRPQEITNFISGEEPLTAVVLIDTSASMTAGLGLAQHAAEQFVIRMRPGDLARVGTFSDRLTLHPRFTDDRDALLRAIREDFVIGNPTRLLDAVDNAISVLAPEGGRRVILLLTDGCDTTSRLLPDAVLQRVRTEDVLIYAVQVYSPVRLPPSARSRARLAGTVRCLSLEAPFLPADAFPTTVDDPRRGLAPDVVLERLTAETGGGRFHLRPGDDVNVAFTQLMTELHHLYLLGFVPQNLDGKIHRLRVEVDDRTLAVRARQSYLAAPPNQDGTERR